MLRLILRLQQDSCSTMPIEKNLRSQKNPPHSLEKRPHADVVSKHLASNEAAACLPSGSSAQIEGAQVYETLE